MEHDDADIPAERFTYRLDPADRLVVTWKVGRTVQACTLTIASLAPAPDHNALHLRLLDRGDVENRLPEAAASRA